KSDINDMPLFTLMAVSVSAEITGGTHGLNALPKHLNAHGVTIIISLNLIAGAVGAAFFAGITNIGEKLSSAATPQQAVLDGIHWAMGSALLLCGLMVFFAMKLHANSAA
ncbi:MAG: MFS transporter, partial [Neisseria elongata]